MRIVAIVERAWIGQAPSGGAERMIHLLMSHLASQGWEAVGVVTNGLPYHRVTDGVEVIVSQEKNKIHELASSADIILTHLGATPRARGMARIYGKPLVQLIHNTSDYTVGFLGDGCDFAIYNSEWVRDFHEAHKNTAAIKSWQNHQLTELRMRRCSEWPSIVVRPPVLDPKPLKSDGEYITLVNLTPNKGPDVFYRLAEMNPDLKFLAVIGGYEPDKQVIRRDLPNVKIQDHCLDVSEVYEQTRVVLMCSAYESYGLVAVEAAQYGIPTIASDTPGLRECLGQAGFIRDRDDIAGWNQALKYVLEYYDGASARAADRYQQLYQQSVSELEAFTKAMEEVAGGSIDDSRSGDSCQSNNRG